MTTNRKWNVIDSVSGEVYAGPFSTEATARRKWADLSQEGNADLVVRTGLATRLGISDERVDALVAASVARPGIAWDVTR